MQKVNTLIAKTARKYKINDQVSKYRARSAWEKVIGKMFPNAIGKTMVISLEKGVLKIAALTKEIAELIVIYSKRIIAEINEYADKTVVFRIACEY